MEPEDLQSVAKCSSFAAKGDLCRLGSGKNSELPNYLRKRQKATHVAFAWSCDMILQK